VSARTFHAMSSRDPRRSDEPIDVAAPPTARFPATNPIFANPRSHDDDDSA